MLHNVVMRSAPTAADLDVIRRLREEHKDYDGRFGISPTQLERWRVRGLIPWAVRVHEGFGGTRVPPHDEQVVGACRLLGRTSRRGRRWELDAENLFNEDFPLSDRAVRETATYLVGQDTSLMARVWEEAKGEVTLEAGDGPFERNGLIGYLAMTKLPPYFKAATRAEIAWAHKKSPQDPDVIEFADTALTWRLVDYAMSTEDREQLDDVRLNLARHGIETPMKPIGGLGELPLPTERAKVARTLTWEEACEYRNWAHVWKSEPALKRISLFTIMTWVATSGRGTLPPKDLAHPLSNEHLADLRRLRGAEVPSG